jgi:hypothetical protein
MLDFISSPSLLGVNSGFDLASRFFTLPLDARGQSIRSHRPSLLASARGVCILAHIDVRSLPAMAYKRVASLAVSRSIGALDDLRAGQGGSSDVLQVAEKLVKAGWTRRID